MKFSIKQLVGSSMAVTFALFMSAMAPVVVWNPVIPESITSPDKGPGGRFPIMGPDDGGPRLHQRMAKT